MKNPFSRQTQFELFPETAVPEPRKDRPSLFSRSFVFSLENLIMAGMVFTMAVIVSFAFGVERGRRIVPREQAAVRPAQPAEVFPEMPRPQEPSAPEQVLTASALPGVLPQGADAGTDVSRQGLAEPAQKTVDKTASLETIHTVQVASFKQLARAEQEAADLKRMGYDAFTAKKGSYYIVCVGKFSERQPANDLLKPLRKRYLDCYVRRL